MDRQLFSFLGAGLLAAFVCGCASDNGLGGRIREKQALYGSLQHWEKLKIDCGTPALGFTPDMVYLAMGAPSKTESDRETPDGSEGWIYARYYPLIDSGHVFNPMTFTIDALRQKTKGRAFVPDEAAEVRMQGKLRGGASLSNQRSYRCRISFKEGKVISLEAIPNVD